MKSLVRLCFGYTKAFHYLKNSIQVKSKSKIPFLVPHCFYGTNEIFKVQSTNSSSPTQSTPDLVDLIMKIKENGDKNEQYIRDLGSQDRTKLAELSTEQLVELMQCLANVKLFDTDGHKLPLKFLHDLSDECIHRSSSLSIDVVLKLLRSYTSLKKKSRFLYHTIKHSFRKFKRYSKLEIVEFFSIMNYCEIWNSVSLYYRAYEIELYLEKNFQNLNLNEIIVFLNSFILINKPIVSFDLKKKLLLLCFQEINHNTDEKITKQFLQFVCIMPFFTSNMKNLSPVVNDFVEKCTENIDNLNLNIIAHISILTTKFLLFKPNFLDEVYRRFLKEGSNASLITVDEIIYSMTFFNYCCNLDLLDILETEPLKTKLSNPKRYIRLISWFCNVNIFKFSILNEILSPGHLSRWFGKRSVKYLLYPHVYKLDMMLEIEYPSYKYNRLCLITQEALKTCYTWDWACYWMIYPCYTDPYEFNDNESQMDIQSLPYDRILEEVQIITNSILGGEYSYINRLFLHLPRKNVLFGINSDKHGHKLDIKEQWINWKDLDQNLTWYVVTVLIRNEYFEGDAVPLGEEICKIRQFKKLGFNVISIVQDEWLNMNTEEKTVHLKKCIGF